VREGGYLIVAGENIGNDPLLAKLGLSHYRDASSQQCTKDETPPANPFSRNRRSR